jgi:hypothetical protein
MKTKKNTTKKNRTKKRWGGDKKKVESCMNTKCQLWLDQAKKNIEKMKKKIEKNYNEKKKEEKKICGNEKKKEECEKIKNDLLFSKTFLENLNKDSEKTKKIELDTCKTFFCNEGCKDTILEDGEPNILPKGITKKFKKMEDVLAILQKKRKDIFKNKKTVLKDGFYERLKPSDVKKIKKEGAISGCTTSIIPMKI